MRSIVWFREDLRIKDNPAVFQAAEASFDGIVGLYIIDKTMWQKYSIAHCQIEFLLRGLHDLGQTLAAMSIPLLIREAQTTEDIPGIVLSVTELAKAGAVFFNKQYEFDKVERDMAVTQHLEQHKIQVHAYHDQMLLTPRNEPVKSLVFFRKHWVKNFIQQGGIRLLPPVYEQMPQNIESDPIPESFPEFKSSVNPKLWVAGEAVAAKKLTKFVQQDLFTYHENRDLLNIDGTSKLSPYLALGMISPRECFLLALEANDYRLGGGNPGAMAWLNEFIERDFHRHMVMTVPRLSQNQAYQARTEKVEWDFDQKKFEAWQNGKTGYPIIDAAMRQMNKTGWMNARLRTITATFFAKYMFFDWRLGAQYFMSRLIDADFAINNGNWQECAATGPDTAAYFKFFDPIRQSDRYDSEGEFIKKYCKELANMSGYSVHQPYTRAPIQAEKTNYPRPMIVLKDSREKAVDTFRKGIAGSKKRVGGLT